MANTDIELLASLNIDESEKAILNDIKAIQRRLEQSGVGKFKLTAELDNELLKSLREMTKSIEVKSFGKDMAKALIEQFNVVDKESQKLIKSLSNQLQNIRIGEIKTGTLNDNLLRVMNDLGEAVVNSANVIESRMGIFDKFYQFLKGIKTIKIPEVVQSELGDEWKSLRQLYPSKYSKTKGVELDTVYHEMSSQFPEILSPDITTPTEQFKMLSQAIRNYRQDVDKIIPLNESIELEDSVISSIYKELAKLENALHFEDANVSESITAISSESESLQKVEESAKQAAQQKEKFSDANREVRETAEDTTAAVNREVRAFLDMNDLDQILANINMHGQQGNSVFQAFGTTLRDAFYAFTAANLLEDAIREVIDAGREAVEVTKEWNDATTDLVMATGASRDVVDQYMYSYNMLGQELGEITNSTAEAASDYLRQGKTIAETNELIKDSLMLSHTANLSAADSTDYLTAIMNAYKLEAEEVLGVVDKLTEVDMSAAVDAGGIAEALSKTATSAKQTGVEIDQLIGMVTTVGEVTKAGMSEVGNSIRTVFSRMRDIKDGNLTSINEDGEISTLSNIEGVLSAIGVKLRESNTEFRNFYDVLDDTAEKWGSLTTVQKAAVTEVYSGVRQSEKFSVLMENWDKVEKYADISANSAGTATEKFDAYLESIQAKTNSLKASLELLAKTTISEDLYLSVLETGKAMVDATTESGILKSSLVGLASAGALYTFQQLGGFVHNCAQEFSNLSVAMNLVQAGNIGQDELQTIIDLTGGLSQSQTRLLLSTNTLTDAQRIAILMNQGLTQAQAEAQIQTWGLVTAQNGLTTATISLVNVMRGLWSTLMANPLILVATGVTAVVTAFNKYKQSIEETKQATKESATKASELSSELSNLTNEYLHLSEEVKENASVKDELLGVQDDLLEKLGLEKSELDELIEKYGSYSEAIKNASIDKLKESQVDMISGLGVSRDEMIDAGRNNFWGTRNIITASGKDANKAFEILEQEGIVDVGDNLYLDGEDTVEGVLENYAKLESALEALRNSNKFTLSELSDNPLYKAIYDRWSEMKAPVEEYKTSIEELNTNQAAIMTFESLKGADLPDTQESFDVFKQGLIESATASKDFIGTEEEIIATVENYLASVPEFAQFYSKQFKQMEEDANSAASALSNATQSDAVTKLDSLKEGFSKLQEIYNNISSDEGTGITAVVDEEITEIFAGATDELNEFIKTISKSPNDIVACQSAFDNLIYSWLNSANILDVLNDDTVTLIGTFLEEQGVVNATSWLMDELTARKALAKAETEGLTISTANEITALMDEATYSDEARAALARLVLSKETLNGTNIDVSGDIQNLIDLAVQAQATQEALTSLKSYQRASQDFGQTVGDEITADDLAWERARATGAVKSTLKYNPSEGKGNATNSSSGGYKPKSTSTSKSGSAASKEFQEEIDWIQRRNELLQQEHDIKQQIAEDDTKSYNQRMSALNDLIEQDKLRVETAKASATKYNEEWEKAKAGLKNEDIARIMDGSLDISIYADEEYVKLLKEALELFDLAVESKREAEKIDEDSLEHQRETIRLQQEILENQHDILQSKQDMVNAEMDLLKAQGQYVGEGYYKDLIAYSEDMVDSYHDQIANLEEQMSLVDDGSAEYYKLLAEIDDCRESIIECVAQQAEWNYQITRLPIERIQMFRDLYSQIIEDMDNYRSIQDQLGLKPTKEELEQYIALYDEQVDAALKQQEELKKLQAQQGYGSDKYNEIASEIQELDNHINSTLASMTELNNELLQIPLIEMSEEVDKLSTLKDKLNASIAEDNAKGLQTTIDQYAELNKLTVQQLEVLSKQRQAIIDVMAVYDEESQYYKDAQSDLDAIDQTISGLVQEQYAWNAEILKMPVDRLTSVNDNLNSYSSILGDVLGQYQSALDGINYLIDSEIEGLEKQLSLIEQVNRARQVELDIEQSLFELNKAREQRNVKVIREGEIVYENDKDAERQAQANYQDSLLEKQKFQLEEQINQLQTIKNKWSEIVKEKEKAATIEDTDSVLGTGWQEAILSGNNDSLLASFKDLYSVTTDQKNSVDKQIESNERLVQMMEEISTRYQDGSLTYENALNNISNLISASKDGYDALENLSGMMNLDNIASLGDIASSADSSIKESAELLSQYIQIIEANKQSVDDFETSWDSMSGAVQETVDSFNAAVGSMDSYIEVFNKNAEAINEHTLTWDEMKQSIAEQVEALKKAAEALEKAQATRRPSSGGGGGGGGSDDSGPVRVTGEKWGGGFDDAKYYAVYGKNPGDKWTDGYTGEVLDATTSAEFVGRYTDDDVRNQYAEYRENLIQETYEKKHAGDTGWLEAAQKGLEEELTNAGYKDYEFGQRYHKGIFKGAIDEGNTQLEDMLMDLAKPNLASDEVPIIAQKGEFVYQPEQIIDTIRNVQRMVLPPMEPLLPHLRVNENTGLPMINNQVNQIKDMIDVGPRSIPAVNNNNAVNNQNVEVNVGGVTVNEVDNAQQLMSEVFNSVGSFITQRLTRPDRNHHLY